ncbi:MAG: TatD family hydrolase [Myxococcota bacterium]
MYVDVHAHLVHASFVGDEDAAAERAAAAGVERVIVNGLEPISNRKVLELCARHPNLLPACGIYPVDAIARVIDRATWTHSWEPPAPFDTDAEVDWIASVADRLAAIGECGLDLHWDTTHLAEQERVLRRLVEVALAADKPLILHTRKAEERTLAILVEMGVKRADFHCFGGKLKLAQKVAEAGYHLSIPPVVVRAEAFQRMVEKLPLESLLTETDCPYMGPVPNERNEPANVPIGVATMARLRRLSVEAMAAALRANFTTLFRS